MAPLAQSQVAAASHRHCCPPNNHRAEPAHRQLDLYTTAAFADRTLLCSFCKQHFYDQTAMFTHMEQHHYHCHLCRRENPDNYIYFKDYRHLEEHFEQKHFLCPFEECRQLKFVVFSTEAELRRHMMAEHAAENNNMKRHERRAALTLETGFMTAPRVRALPPAALGRCTSPGGAAAGASAKPLPPNSVPLRRGQCMVLVLPRWRDLLTRRSVAAGSAGIVHVVLRLYAVRDCRAVMRSGTATTTATSPSSRG